MIKRKDFKTLWYLLDSKNKKKTPLIIFFLIIGMIFEIFGLGILFPIVISLLDINQLRLSIKETFYPLHHYIEALPDESLIFMSLFILVILYLLKTVYLIFLSYYQNNYLVNVSRENANKLFKYYLAQDYAYFINANSSKIIKMFQIEVNYITAYLSSFLHVITEFCFVVAIFLTLIFIAPVGALTITAFFGIMAIVFFSLVKKRITRYGEKREVYDKSLAKVILETIQTIKEVKLLGTDSFFIKKQQYFNQQKAIVTRNQLFIGQLPRHFLELVAVIALILFIIILVMKGINITQLITTLTVFVAASFRMIPSLNRVLSGLQSIRYYQSGLNTLKKEYESFSFNSNPVLLNKEKIHFKKELRLSHVSFGYSKKEVLSDINLSVKRGSSVGIIGTSGAGKSTLLDIFIGLLKPNKGAIYCDNDLIVHENIRAYQNKIGYVSQMINLIDDTIARNIAFGIEDNEVDQNKMLECIKKAQLSSFIEDLPIGLDTIVGERGVQLSGGQRQRIGIARALYHNPEILIFDEATSALDEETESSFMQAVNQLQREKTIIIVTHRLSTLKSCDAIYTLENGKLNLKKV